ncbi:MAG: TRAP transporter large permease subunit, partial [Proteobacteria bacterium]|nr:TRAP transporter large permease subunit [Pseudomonadota bacterium]
MPAVEAARRRDVQRKFRAVRRRRHFQSLTHVMRDAGSYFAALGSHKARSGKITSTPIIAPVMFQLGFDPVWFGILIVLLMETAMITPQVGINLFVVQGVRGHGPLHDVAIGAIPFVFTLLVMIGVLVIFPDLALWLPRAA